MASYFQDPGTRTPSAVRDTPRYSVGMSYPRPRSAPLAVEARDGGPDAVWPEVDESAYVARNASAWRPLVHGAGALISLSLLAGLGVWGYGQVMRDVAGVPVVEAAAGPMRVAPERPGGQITDHAGLTVNDVKAGAPGTELPENVVLAPPPVDLAPEDKPRPALTTRPAADGTDPQRPTIDRLTEVATEDAAPEALPALVETRQASGRQIATPEELALAEAVAASLTAGLSGGMTAAPAADAPPAASPRPVRRPAPGSAATATGLPIAGPPLIPAPTVTDLAARGPDPAEATEPPAPGTRLVQLGAFPSAEEARAEWGALTARFAPLMERKGLVLQQAEAGGRAFWRLRAQGFEDLAQARRFCAALVAEGADCIPVPAR